MTTECIMTRLSRSSNTRTDQNFLLICLDANIDELNDNGCQDALTRLRQTINPIHTFTNADQCIDFLADITDEKVVLIISGTFGQHIVPLVHEMSQIDSIFIYCENNFSHKEWSKQWSKVKGIFTNISPICDALRQAAREFDQKSTSISYVPINGRTYYQNFDQSFMYTRIFKEIFLTIYAEGQVVGNGRELHIIKKLDRDYYHYLSIWWYTKDYFLHLILHRPSHTAEVGMIIEADFFVRYLHRYMVSLHYMQLNSHHLSYSFIVDHIQDLSKTDFDQLMKTKGGLKPFNNFLSTSKYRTVHPDPLVILFVMDIVSSISSTPFASINAISYHQTLEDEVLFLKHSIIRIGQIKQIDHRACLWQVELTLTSEENLQLNARTERIPEETLSIAKRWCPLSKLLIELDHFNKVEQLHEVLPPQTTDIFNKLSFNYALRVPNDRQKDDATAILFYRRLLQILRINKSPTHLDRDCPYDNTDLIYMEMNNWPRPRSFFEHAIDIGQRLLHINHFFLIF